MDNIKILKLVSGETIVAFIQENVDTITISKPIQFTLVPKGPGSGTLVASEWIHSDESVFKLKNDHVVATATPTESMRTFYIKSISEFVSDKSSQRILENLIEDFAIKSTIVH